MIRLAHCTWWLATLALLVMPTQAAEPQWQAGAAQVTITPEQLMWMSGYGNRDHPAEGKLHDLWAKALVIEDPNGHRAALITLDLVGIDRATSQEVCRRLESQYGLTRPQVAINASHTHCGPAVGRNLWGMFFLDDAQWNRVDHYTAQLVERIVAAVGEALDQMAPARLSYGTGKATFAVNRRNNPRDDVPELRRTHQLQGPNDHDVPVLAVHSANGERLLAVVAGYACHATTLAFFEWCGDYPGFYQLMIEENHPGTVAMFWAGCGADQNPLPRRTVELCEQYGRRLADVVETVLVNPMQPIDGELACVYREIPLSLEAVPTAAELEERKASSNRFEANLATVLLKQIEDGRPIEKDYPYPVQTWQLGDLTWHFLGGEVVVDFALRFKQHAPRRTWVAGYSNDVMAYIPSRRVWEEGGYEGANSMVYYGLPSRWADDVEERVVAEVSAQAAEVRKPAEKSR